ncbi:MAG: nitronate monooxygenase family protein [Alphaproteobacteria bacterium]|jgi:enoyl-[acyl-carrier protein] reductase II|nr:nitronate monooxygenase family protein [Alphaproteobacteria bacterium]
MNKNDKLETLWKVGKDFLGVDYPIMGGAMSWISESKLVSAVSNAGAFGVIASGSMDAPLLLDMIKKTKEKTSKPFGINLIVMNPHLDSLVDVCIDQKTTHVIFAGGFPSVDIIKKLKDKNIKTVAFAPNLSLGKRLVKNGIDALIIEGSEAGGHIGPVSTSVLAQEILPNIKDVPVFVAGGIGRGEILVNYLELGAAGVQIGTSLVCSTECIAHDKFKEAFIKASARDAQSTQQVDNDFPVIPVRAIVNKGSKDFLDFQKDVISQYKEGSLSKYDAQMKIEHYWVGALRKAVVDGDVENGSLMAGQSVGLVNSIRPCKEIIEELITQATEYLSK